MPYRPLSPIENLPSSALTALENAVNVAFGASFVNTASSLTIPPGEVDLVLGLFLDGLGQLEILWNGILGPHGAQVTISGIFAHATPLVAPYYYDGKEEQLADAAHPSPKTTSCELGDLLFVVLPVDHPEGIGNSALFQAKIGFPAGGDPLQRRLYEYASHFAYNKPYPLTGQNRCILDKHDTHLSYWDLGSPPVCTYAGKCIEGTDARAGNYGGIPFSTTLVKLMCGEFGRGFRVPTSVEVSWSRVMYDLFRVTAQRAVNRSSMNVRGSPRGPVLDDLVWRTAALQGGPLIVRNSLGKIFRLLGGDLEDYGAEIERRAVSPLPESDRNGKSKPPRPPVTMRELQERESDGISIVFINVSKPE